MKAWRRSAVLVSSFSLLGLTVAQAGERPWPTSSRAGSVTTQGSCLAGQFGSNLRDRWHKGAALLRPVAELGPEPIGEEQRDGDDRGRRHRRDRHRNPRPADWGVVSIDVATRGHGYTSAPTVTITGGTTAATAHALINATGG